MNFTNRVKNKCEKIFSRKKHAFAICWTFSLVFQKSSLPMTHQGGTRAREEGGSADESRPSPSMCKQHLIIKLKKHTNEIKTFSKWAAALRPDFVGPRPANLCLCHNWAPGKAGFWCQQEGRTQPVEAGRLGEQPPSLCYPLSWSIAHFLGLSLSICSDPTPVTETPHLTHIDADDSRISLSVPSFSPELLTQSHQHMGQLFFSKVKTKMGKEKNTKSQNPLLTPLPLWL